MFHLHRSFLKRECFDHLPSRTSPTLTNLFPFMEAIMAIAASYHGIWRTWYELSFNIGQSASHIVEMVNSQRPPGENAPAPHMKSLVNAWKRKKDFWLAKDIKYKDCTFFMTYHATAIYNLHIYIHQLILVLWLLRDRSILLLWVMFGELQSESFWTCLQLESIKKHLPFRCLAKGSGRGCL